MKIKGIWRYPCKSMGGEKVESTPVHGGGLPGDRAWAVRDSKAVRGAKKFPSLLTAHASYAAPPWQDTAEAPWIQLPGGDQFQCSDEAANGKLSEYVGEAVTLHPLHPADDPDFFLRANEKVDARAILGLEKDEPFPDFSGFPAELGRYVSPPGSYFDAYPLLVLTTSSLNSLQQAAPESIIDARRFRPNLLIDCRDSGFVEELWEGKSLRIGSLVIRLTLTCPRCVMATLGFDDLPRDPNIMRALVRANHHKLGIYGEVEQPGTIQTGDTVILEDPELPQE